MSRRRTPPTPPPSDQPEAEPQQSMTEAVELQPTEPPPTPQRPKQTNADRAIATLTDDERDELTSLCLAHANATEVHRWLGDRVEGVSYSSVLTWLNREFPPGATAISLNRKLQQYRGFNPVDAHLASLCEVSRLLDLLLARIANGSDLQALTPTVFSNLTDLLKEQRQSAQALVNYRQMSDRKNLELAGGYRLLEIASRHAEGSPHAAVLVEMLKGAIAQLEDEVN
jgi:hypothetical protein